MTTEEKFCAAVGVIDSLPKDGSFQPSLDLMLKFKAYYMQATEGPCTLPKPSFFDYNKQEWYAWQSLGDMSKDTAMEKYVEELLKIVETMSYTKTVADFLDVMGPFYEVVWPDNVESNETSIPNPTDHSEQNEGKENEYLKTNDAYAALVDSQSFTMFPIQKEDYLHIERIQFSHFNPSDDHSNISLHGHPLELRDNMSLATIQSDVITSDVLSSSILNLQTSLDSIVQHLTILEDLAKKYKCQTHKNSCPGMSFKKWKWKPITISLFVLWPFLVNWLLNTLRQSRNFK